MKNQMETPRNHTSTRSGRSHAAKYRSAGDIEICVRRPSSIVLDDGAEVVAALRDAARA
jgi:hypothetical protein